MLIFYFTLMLNSVKLPENWFEFRHSNVCQLMQFKLFFTLYMSIIAASIIFDIEKTNRIGTLSGSLNNILKKSINIT